MKKSAMGFIAIVIVATSLFVSCNKDKKEETPAPAPTTGTFTDSRDSKTYKTIVIGTQTWMAENLNYQGLPPGSDTCYANNSANCTTYGALYTWSAANLAAPAGWHLASDAEWKTLEKYLGMSQTEADLSGAYRGTDQGTKLKEGGTSGLNLKFGGMYQGGSFVNGATGGSFWTSTSATAGTAYLRAVDDNSNGSKVFRGTYTTDYRFSVRCIKD